MSALRVFVVASISAVSCASSPPALFAQPADPAAWGGDHVGQGVPNFTSGDECLFCHRDVGPGWPTNRHGQTIRLADPATPALSELAKLPQFKSLAGEVEFVLGGSHRQRFLKRSAEHGKLDLLTSQWIPPTDGKAGQWLALERPRWDQAAFGSQCAGCHSTGVDSTKQSFAALSLDCFVCHGQPPDKHTAQGSLAILSPHRSDSAAVVTSICAQCHLRAGASKTSGRPYPNNFVAGDNLFRDFRIDLAAALQQAQGTTDQHVLENVRDIWEGRQDVTCLSCHDIHRQSSEKHQTMADGKLCLVCHVTGSKQQHIPLAARSKTCGY